MAKIAQYRELVDVIIMEQQIEKIQNLEEQRPFINMVAEAIEEKDWSDKVFICDEDGIETDDIKDSTKIIVETKDGYEIRKMAIPLGSLFEITWGSDGIGTTKYEVTGALLFRNKAYSSQTINILAELELGTYQIKCTITTPQTKIIESAIKTVTIGTLATTSMNDVGGGYRSSNI